MIEDSASAVMADIDPILSVIACMYKLIKANPGRFCEAVKNKDGNLLDECTWGIHHEDWLRAQTVVYFVKNRRAKAKECPEPGQVVYTSERGRIEHSEIYGYATLDVLASVADPEAEHSLTLASEIVRERRLLSKDVTRVDIRELTNKASDEQIIKAIDAIGELRLLSKRERQQLLADTDGALAEVLTESVSSTLQLIAPGIDLSKALSKALPARQRRRPITAEELEELRKTLEGRIHIHRTAGGNETNRGCYTTLRDNLQAVAAAGDITALANEAGQANIIDDATLDTLHSMRAKLGECLPPKQNLAKICKRRGIDLETLGVNPNNPSTRAKPPQIPGLSYSLAPWPFRLPFKGRW